MKKKVLKYTVAGLVITAAVTVGLLGLSKPQSVYTIPVTTAEFANTSVQVMAPDLSSGGSGVILRSNSKGSIVLTNKHVCELIQTGGLIVTQSETVEIIQYKIYTKHDLCLVRVRSNLGINTAVALEEPELFSESVVAGHPHLLPFVLSRGHFSEKKEISLVVGTKPCDGTEDENDAFTCMFMGLKPVLKSFDSQLISSLIMPGSSGSPVFNDRGEIAGLVFAGLQGLGYGFIVPHKYVRDFLANEAAYKWRRVNPNAKPKKFLTAMLVIMDMCQVNRSEAICKTTKYPSIWSK